MDGSSAAAVTAAALTAAVRDAHHWYTAQAARNPTYTAELAARGLTASQARAAGIGWAPSDGSALTDHLVRRGHRLAALRDAGLSVRRGPRHHDVFRNRVTFAYRDQTGTITGFTARTAADAAAKWLNTPSNTVFDKSALLYGGHAIEPGTHTVAIVEGAWDAATVTAATSGRIVGVAACGTAFTPTHAQTVASWGLPVIVATDADPAGRTAAVRIHDTLATAGVTNTGYLELEDGHDPSSWHAADHDLTAALADVTPGSLTRHVIDTHRQRLDPSNGIPLQLAELRALAPSLTSLTTAEQADAITYLNAITELMPLTIHDTLTRHTEAQSTPERAGPPPAPKLSSRAEDDAEVEMEGLDELAATRADLNDDYIAGQITADELVDRSRARYRHTDDPAISGDPVRRTRSIQSPQDDQGGAAWP